MKTSKQKGTDLLALCSATVTAKLVTIDQTT